MPTAIKADIPATVWQVRVAIGEEGAAADELDVLESIRWTFRSPAPRAGVVTALHVTANDRVAEGDPIADIG